jgi:VanZ family protein
MIKRYKYTLALSLVILYLSLKNANDLNKVQFLNIPHFDKFAHTCMYFALMSAVIFETWRSAIKTSQMLILAIFPFLYGIIMEILQATLTTTRTGSPYDVIFNTVGILISIFGWKIIQRVYKEKLR